MCVMFPYCSYCLFWRNEKIRYNTRNDRIEFLEDPIPRITLDNEFPRITRKAAAFLRISQKRERITNKFFVSFAHADMLVITHPVNSCCADSSCKNRSSDCHAFEKLIL